MLSVHDVFVLRTLESTLLSPLPLLRILGVTLHVLFVTGRIFKSLMCPAVFGQHCTKLLLQNLP
jgi:hypothetical protein